jgi:hypothetical protein
MFNNDQFTVKRAAAAASIALIAMTFLAIFAYGYAHATVFKDYADGIVDGHLLLLEIAAWILIIGLDAVVAISLWRFFLPVSRRGAYWLGGLRLAYTAILAIAVAVFAQVYPMLGTLDRSSVALQVARFEHIWSLGLVVFGLHLIWVGYVSFRAAFFPKWLAYLIIVAGFSYCTIHGLYQLAPGLNMFTARLEMILALPMTAGEAALAVWLWISGRNVAV